MSEPEAHSLEEINRRLAEIDAALDGPAHEPSPEQYQLLVERDSLRAQASRFRSGRDSGRSDSELRAELGALERRLRAQVTSHTGYVTSKGGGSHSPSPGAWVTLAAQTRASSEIARLRTRIGEIETELERRAATD